MSSRQHQLAAQAARVLEQLQTLTIHYGAEMAESQPDLASSMAQCAEELSRYLSTVDGAPQCRARV